MRKFYKIILLLGFLVFSTRNFLWAQDASDAATDAGAASGAPTGQSISIAVFPLISTGLPPPGTEGVIDSSLIQQDISAGISASASGPFIQTNITNLPRDFDPGLPPDPSICEGATYSVTSQLFYDNTAMQTQGQIWLYDNTIQQLVSTDQFVFPIFGSSDTPESDAANMSAALLDYLLGRIPTYTVTATVGRGGIVTLAGAITGVSSTADSQALLEDQSARPAYVFHGSQDVSLIAVPDPGYVFDRWNVNGDLDSSKGNPLNLTLNPQLYPGKSTPNDPWATKVPIRIQAYFVQDTSTPSPVKKPSPPPKESRWYAGAGWLPHVHLAGAGDDFFHQTFFPTSFVLEGGFFPLTGDWGRIGAAVELGWTSLSGTHDSWNLNAELGTAGAYALYRSPLLFNFLIPEVRLGGGMGLVWGINTKQGSKTDWKTTSLYYHPWVDLGLAAWMHITGPIWGAVGTDFRLYFFGASDTPKSPFYLMPRLELSWAF
jgi:hypothetical protein